MNFCWSTWTALFIVGQPIIPYVFEIDFYDTGISETYIEVITS